MVPSHVLAQGTEGEARMALRQSQQTCLTGHTHFADAHDWTEGGAAYQHLNSGTWRHQQADLVVIEDGQAVLHQRTWNEPLPDLS